MRRTVGWAAAAVMVAAAGAGAASAAPAVAEVHGVPEAPFSDAVLARQFETFLAWFGGEFDNGEQVHFAKELAYPADALPYRIHSTFAPVALPWLGDHVFYTEQYLGMDPAHIYRQRLYSFSPDPVEKAIRLDIYTPRNPKALVGAQNDPSKLAALTKADLQATPGCEVYWRMQANQFAGYMKPGACRVASHTTGKPIFISDNLVLTADEIWIGDEAVDEKGGYVFGDKAGIPSKLRRVHTWTCWMAVPRADRPGTWFYAKDIKVGDQAGETFVTTDEAKPQALGYRLRQVKWPSGTNADALTLYVLRQDDDKAISYAWADPDAKRIGINLRWMQGSCTR